MGSYCYLFWSFPVIYFTSHKSQIFFQEIIIGSSLSWDQSRVGRNMIIMLVNRSGVHILRFSHINTIAKTIEKSSYMQYPCTSSYGMCKPYNDNLRFLTSIYQTHTAIISPFYMSINSRWLLTCALCMHWFSVEVIGLMSTSRLQKVVFPKVSYF